MDTLVTTEADIRVVDAAGTEQILVGELGWLQGAEFVRAGPDLMLVGKDGAQVLLQDYFMQAEPSDLLTTNGGVFDAQLVARLAGPMAPGQVAQTTPSSPEPIGQVDTIEGAVDAARADGTKVKLAKGDPVFQGDVIETGANGSVGLILADDSTFSIAEDGRVVRAEIVNADAVVRPRVRAKLRGVAVGEEDVHHSVAVCVEHLHRGEAPARLFFDQHRLGDPAARLHREPQ